ncbi:hypothetical protein R3P38DRAFT_2768419 [Favolaschia claudopus]|uniref:Uncharacterized protein n=1 Tax=Favolaschia claudopus TaxID=2862362 RepID=A0AAW0CM48_9AGAR
MSCRPSRGKARKRISAKAPVVRLLNDGHAVVTSLGGCCTGGNFNLSVPPPPPISEPHLMPRAFTKERARDDAEQQADELLVLSLLLEEDDDLEAELMGIDLADEELDVWDSSLLADNELTELLELVALDWMEIAAYLGDTSRGPYNDIPKSTDFFYVLLSKYVLGFFY